MLDLSYEIERRMAGRWIAGPNSENAINLSKKINAHKISVMINYLGEDFARKHDVADAVGMYMMLIDEMSSQRVHGDISLKPTGIGLGMSQELFESNLMEIVEHGKKKGIFVWLDMEGPALVTKTIEAYLKVIKEGNVGICIQSYMRRSEADIKSLVKAGATIRLVKGAYGLKENITFDNKREITDSFADLMRYLFEHSERFMLATHDDMMINEAIGLNRKHKRNVTYAMLFGIRNKRALSLARSGHKVALYVPFGSRWVGFAYRRIKEGGHIPLLIRSVLSNQSI